MNQSRQIIEVLGEALGEGKQLELEEWLKVVSAWMGTANDAKAKELDVAPFNREYKLLKNAVLYRGMSLELLDLQGIIHKSETITHSKFSSWTYSLDQALDSALMAPGTATKGMVPVVFKAKFSPNQVLIDIKRLCKIKPNGWEPPSFCDEEEVIVRPGAKVGKSNLVKIDGKPWKTVKKWKHGMVTTDLTKPPKARF